jgi:Ca-activated chloride channel homolog
MRRWLTSLVLTLAGPATAVAQGWIEPPRVIAPRPTQVVRVASNVRATVEGRVVRVEVEEHFRNTGGGLGEGTYHYPMAPDAVFQSLSLWMGDQEVRGELMDAERARGIYDAIVRQRKDPALVTLAGHRLLRAQVFPIQPGETRKVVLRFTQVLPREGDAVRWRYALGPEQRGAAPTDVRVTLTEPGQFGRAISPTHPLVQPSPREVRIENASSGDVDLVLPLRSTDAGITVLPYAPGGEAGYFLMYVTPPELRDAQSIARDLTMVVDVSGSMSGRKMEQAKAALRQMLGGLTERDRVRLIAFSSRVRTFRDGLVAVTRDTRRDAEQWVDALVADGGTNIEGALQEALRSGRNGAGDGDGRLDLLVFLTDGVPSVGEQRPEQLAAYAARTGASVRMFTVGIGADVNTYLLERLAQDGNGQASFVPPTGNVEDVVSDLARTLRAPALVDLRIADSPVRLTNLEPGRLPDLFSGQELVVLGRYEGSGRGPMVIEGMRNGQRVRVSATVDFPARESNAEHVGTLWAARRIGALTRTLRLEGSTPARIEEIRQLALRHGIVTEFTSYLVLEPGMEAAPVGCARCVRRTPMPVAAAPAPSAQAGQGAFDNAQTSADLARAGSVTAAREASVRAEKRADRERAALGASQRQVAQRVFEQRGAQWVDRRQGSQRTVDVEAWSAAHLALLRALPELREAQSLGDDLTIAGTRVSIRVQARGQATMSGTEVQQMVREFRGS